MKIAISLILLLISNLATAFSVSPGELPLAAVGEKSTGLFVVDNPDIADANVAVKVFKKSFDEYGVEKQTETKGDLLIFPTTLKVKAKSKAVVRVVYTGNKHLTEQANYRIKFTGLDIVKYSQKKSGKQEEISAVLSYGMNISVAPETAMEKPLTIEDVVVNNTKFIKLTNHSNINKSAKDSTIKITLKDKKAPVEIKTRSIKVLLATIHPNSYRLIPLPETIKNEKILKVELEDAD